MGLAHAPEHQLIGFGVALETHGRVLGHKTGQSLRELVIVGLGVSHDRDGEQRVGHDPRLDQERCLLVGERVAGLGTRKLCDRDDVTRDRGLDRALRLAQWGRQRAHPLVEVVVLVPAVGTEVP